MNRNYLLLWVILVAITVTAFGTWGYYYGYNKAIIDVQQSEKS